MHGRIPVYKPGGSCGPTACEAERKRFYNSARWLKLRAVILAKQPLCEVCLAKGLVVEATTVHHRLERLLSPDLAFAESNLASVCPSCHTRHHATARATPGVASTSG